MKPTHITLAPDGRLCVDAPYHPAIVARLKDLQGEWDKARKVWYIAAWRADRLLEALPLASYAPDALDACWDAPARRMDNFATGLLRLGVRLGVDAQSGVVFAEGDNLSPIIHAAVAERADGLREWMAAHDGEVRPGLRPVAVDVEPDAGMDLIHRGMVNAAAAELRAKERATRARVTRRRTIEQAELALG